MQAIKREGQPEDLCGALVFLASDESAWMTGETINIDGGWADEFSFSDEINQ